MGTEIFKFGPEKAEKFTSKDCNFILKSLIDDPNSPDWVSHK